MGIVKVIRILFLALLVSCVTACTNTSRDASPDEELISDAQLQEFHCYTDLHLHLDGFLSFNTVKTLAKLQGILIDMTDQELSDTLQVNKNETDLNGYLTKFTFPLTLLQTKTGLSNAAYLLCKELKADGLMYAEIRFAPQLHCNKGLTQREAVTAALDGLKRSSLPATLILCCMRGNDNHDKNIETVQIAKDYLDQGVGAIDLAGAEAVYPTADFAYIFHLTRQLKVPFTIHAGEAGGPESVYKALAFGAKRIGHGVRSVEDTTLLSKLARECVTLECCPTSNVNTSVFPSIDKFPYRKLLDANVKFTINSDNMTVSNTNVVNEYVKLNDAFHLHKDEVRLLLENSVDAAFTTEEVKSKLRLNIASCFAAIK